MWNLRGGRVTGPLASYAGGFADQLLDQDYAPGSVSNQLWLMSQLSAWLADHGLDGTGLSPATVGQFVCFMRANGRRTLSARGLLPLLEYLRGLGSAPAEPEPDDTPRRRLLGSYRRYLIGERGLASLTVAQYLRVASVLLARLPDPLDEALNGLSADWVVRFVGAYGPRAKSVACPIRAFLRFLYASGQVDRQLAGVVPPVARWKLAGLPGRLDAVTVRAVLSACDRTRESGRRNYAILLLLARLGLRTSEVIGLALDDVRWRSGVIVIHRKGARSEELPLLPDVGQAIADYLLFRPPGIKTRALFVTCGAPRRKLANTAVNSLLKRTCINAGVALIGPHAFRHALACELLGTGASLSEIGLVLGHRDPGTTAIYAKVDHAALAELVRPWPMDEVAKRR
jgi:integrase